MKSPHICALDNLSFAFQMIVSYILGFLLILKRKHVHVPLSNGNREDTIQKPEPFATFWSGNFMRYLYQWSSSSRDGNIEAFTCLSRDRRCCNVEALLLLLAVVR